MSDSKRPFRVRNFLYKKLDTNKIETGFLDIAVFHEEFSQPLQNAIVKIYKISVSGEYNEKGEGKLINQFITDESGKIPSVELQVINELMPDKNDYYYIAVHHLTHHSAYIFNVEIYQDITTNVQVSLKYRYTNEEFFQFNMQPRKSEINSH